MRLSASLSPPHKTPSEDGHDGQSKTKPGAKKGNIRVEIPEIDLSRASPFGPLSQITARRTFAYLIATLNASHPDYDFSHLLRPRDFRKERSLRGIMQNIDSTLANLRPRQGTSFLAPPSFQMLSNSAPMLSNQSSATGEIWNPRMWSLIDKEMGLRQCEKYTYVPDDDPFDGEEGAIWSLHYFFFNKERKRVCYLYLRGLSVISHSPVRAAMLQRPRLVDRERSSVSVGDGAQKRASYWLGNRVLEDDVESYGEDDDDEMIIEEPGDDEVETNTDLDDIRSGLTNGYYSYDGAEDYDDVDGSLYRSRLPPRGMSEEVAEAMEM